MEFNEHSNFVVTLNNTLFDSRLYFSFNLVVVCSPYIMDYVLNRLIDLGLFYSYNESLINIKGWRNVNFINCTNHHAYSYYIINKFLNKDSIFTNNSEKIFRIQQVNTVHIIESSNCNISSDFNTLTIRYNVSLSEQILKILRNWIISLLSSDYRHKGLFEFDGRM